MSILIDEVQKSERFKDSIVEINGKWYCAKPLPFYGLSWSRFKLKLLDIYRVIRNRGIVVHYKEDE